MERRWLIGGLVASVGLNLFLLGVGAAVLGQRHRAERMAPPASVLQVAARLDPKDQAAFRRLLRQQGRKIAPDLKMARLARRDAARLMAEPAYDRTAIAADLARAREAEGRARAQLEGAVVDFAQDLDADERATLAKALKRGLDANRRAMRRDRGARRDPLGSRRPASSGGLNPI
jgi:uncharacterized membrane protein